MAYGVVFQERVRGRWEWVALGGVVRTWRSQSEAAAFAEKYADEVLREGGRARVETVNAQPEARGGQ